jgi:hypothetical protein
MSNKKLLICWILCSVIMVIGIHYLDGLPEIDDWFSFSVGVLLGVALLLIASILLSLIISALPFKANKRVPRHRVKSFMPLSMVSLTIIALIAFVLTRPSYAKAAPAEARLCKTVQNGRFLLDEYIIDRQHKVHTETSKITNQTATFKVEWISDCEFKLTNASDSNDTTKVKIIEVTDTTYKCLATSGKRTTTHELSIERNGN